MKTITAQSTQGRDGQPPLTAVHLTVGRHTLIADTGTDNLGHDLGLDAHDFYDAALASCKAMTVLWYARKKSLPLQALTTYVQADRSQERQGTYRLAVRLELHGALSEAQVKELQSVAERCPVHRLMSQVSTEIDTAVALAQPD